MLHVLLLDARLAIPFMFLTPLSSLTHFCSQYGFPAGLSAGLPTERRGSEHADPAAADDAEPGPQPDAGPDQQRDQGLRGQVHVTPTIRCVTHKKPAEEARPGPRIFRDD